MYNFRDTLLGLCKALLEVGWAWYVIAGSGWDRASCFGVMLLKAWKFYYADNRGLIRDSGTGFSKIKSRTFTQSDIFVAPYTTQHVGRATRIGSVLFCRKTRFTIIVSCRDFFCRKTRFTKIVSCRDFFCRKTRFTIIVSCLDLPYGTKIRANWHFF
jgi:hypothetical protein